MTGVIVGTTMTMTTIAEDHTGTMITIHADGEVALAHLGGLEEATMMMIDIATTTIMEGEAMMNTHMIQDIALHRDTGAAETIT